MKDPGKTSFLLKWTRLVRLPNLLMVLLTQLLLYYCILRPGIYPGGTDASPDLTGLALLVIATVLTAAGGYVINDYFDTGTDSINRPETVVVSRSVTVHAAIKVHMILSGIAVILGIYLAWQVRSVSFGFIFPLVTGLLWIYSAKYKRMPFWGNLIVSGLSAFVILIVWLYEFFLLRLDGIRFASVMDSLSRINVLVLAYALFAFLLTLVREIIKDLEDWRGDQAAGSHTLPIAIGLRNTRFVTAAILAVTMILLGYALTVLYRLGLLMAFWYMVVTVLAGSVYLLAGLFRAREKKDYHYLSTLCKLIMVAGILSMEVLFISY